MGLQSLNGGYSDGGSQVLWEDGERVVRRGWRLEPDGNRRAVLIVVPAAQHPSRSSLDHLTHEYDLKDQLDGSWAVRPLDLVHDAGRISLVLEGMDGEPLDRLLGAPMEVGRFFGLAITIAAASVSACASTGWPRVGSLVGSSICTRTPPGRLSF